jgi:hypothetical protein
MVENAIEDSLYSVFIGSCFAFRLWRRSSRGAFGYR